MRTVRDRSEFGAALRDGAAHIEVRGVLAGRVSRGRAAAALAAVTGTTLAVASLCIAVFAARQGAALALGEPGALALLMALLVTLAAVLFALQSAGPAAFRTLRVYREVYRAQGVVVLRRA
jgi:hypothetical protein